MSDITIDIPDGNNIFITRRNNFGMDICAWNETMRDPLISSLTGHPIKSYRYIIWLNASVRGPFIPVGQPFAAWLPYFLNQINDHDKLIGTSISCMAHIDRIPDRARKEIFGRSGRRLGDNYPEMHLQSQFVAFDWQLLPILLPHLVCASNKHDVIRLVCCHTFHLCSIPDYPFLFCDY
jgi:hypothetical protein